MATESCPDNENQSENEDVEKFLFDVAKKYSLGLITDDNDSPTNYLSGLEQIVAFKYGLDLNSEEDMERLNELKEKILHIVDINYNGGYYSKYCMVDIVNEMESLYEHGDEDYLKEYISEYFGEDKFEIWIDELASGLIKGVLTVDNPSPRTGLSGLDQAILTRTNLKPYSNVSHWITVELIKASVNSRITDYCGGHRLNNFSNKLTDLEVIWEKE